jgi:hypothetical protein
MFGGSNIYLHRINSPNAKGSKCNFIQRDIELPNRHSGILPYFPNFKLGPVIGSSCDSIYSLDLSKDLFIGPNPVYDELKIVLNKDYQFSELIQFELYTIDGKILIDELMSLSRLESKINLRSVVSGLYFYKLTSMSSQWMKSGKLIVIH